MEGEVAAGMRIELSPAVQSPELATVGFDCFRLEGWSQTHCAFLLQTPV